MRKYRNYHVDNSIDLNPVFKVLRKLGYYAKQISVNRKPDEVTEKWVMFSEESYRRKINGDDFFLDWKGDGHEICRVLREHGIQTEWGGSEDITIKVIQ